MLNGAFLKAFILILILNYFSVLSEEKCPSPQYLEIGKVGVVFCEFETAIYSIHWYDTDDVTASKPTIEVDSDGTIGGPGFTSGEYNINPDGYLIVNNVSVHHETKFTVTKFKSTSELPVVLVIEVKVIVIPVLAYPVIYQCSTQEETCFTRLSWNEQLTCKIADARPPVDLSWHLLTKAGQTSIPFTRFITNGTITQSSYVEVADVFEKSPSVVLLVCKAETDAPLLNRPESFVLAQNQNIGLIDISVTDVIVEKGQSVNLTCSSADIDILVWEKRDLENNFETIAYYINFETVIHKSLDESVEISNQGSLVIPDVRLEHESYYRCLYNNGTGDVAAFKIAVYVSPSPAYPVVDGCPSDRYCTLNVERQGTLTCTVKGIRPAIELQWMVHYEDSIDQISFHNQQSKILTNDGTSDVIHTTEYKVRDTASDRVTVGCYSIGARKDSMALSTTIDLLIARDDVIPTAKNQKETEFPIIIIVIVLVVSFILLVAGVIFVIIKLRRRPKPDTLSNEENFDLKETLLNQPEVAKNKTLLVEQLKGTYANFYNAIKPVPYQREKTYCVQSVFVEGGMSCLEDKALGDKETWEPIQSYQDIWTDPRLRSKRRIIEGGPGYGKSTLFLQMAHDWCSNEGKSALKNVQILILLKLRQLAGISSIYEAIRIFLLPRNSKLKNQDIESILDQSSSVVMLFDGFDEYPDYEYTTDILDIIQSKMYPNFDVILTTRLSDLPKDLAAETKRLRLTGFGSEAQHTYLRKAVTKDDVAAGERIQNVLYENPIFRDLCQIPLFFVMYAHLSQRSKELQTCTSATSFFRYMVSSLHQHLKRKFKDENVEQVDLLIEREHKSLDKIAFESISGTERKTCWKRSDIAIAWRIFACSVSTCWHTTGRRVDRIPRQSWYQAHEHVEYITNVTFYHELFCEWYAAHHLADAVEKLHSSSDEGVSDVLDIVDPSKHQYVFRFACGINLTAADVIIRYLSGLIGRSEIVIMCILERIGSVDKILDVMENLCPILSKSKRITQKYLTDQPYSCWKLLT
ncbi:hypothetical protein BSL78_15342 [Apostichopus japonicus]|uniref:NLR family CARD domain-containing protein 4 n=1 Tax=Stichopus japonicus TaxID=307972 RepID=A0A2G8KII8_STIJA|nr:hypothetical protein BSL78_15342 [Apostichopus japonicus]